MRALEMGQKKMGKFFDNFDARQMRVISSQIFSGTLQMMRMRHFLSKIGPTTSRVICKRRARVKWA